MAKEYESNSINENTQHDPELVFDKSRIDKQDYKFIEYLIETAQQTGRSVKQYGFRVDLPVLDVFTDYSKSSEHLSSFSLSKNGYVIVDATLKKDKLIIDHEEGMTFDLVKAIECACGTETVPRSNENDMFNPWCNYISSKEAEIRLEIHRNTRDYPDTEYRAEMIKALYRTYDEAVEKGKDPFKAIIAEKMNILAYGIEQTMFEQNEYKATNDSRIIFLDNLPGPKELERNTDLFESTREMVIERIKDILAFGNGAPELMTYLEGVDRFINHISVLTEEGLDISEGTISELKTNTAPCVSWLMAEMADLINPAFLDKNAQGFAHEQVKKEIERMKVDPEGIDHQPDMNIMSVDKYLLKEYGDVGDDLSLVCGNKIISDLQFVGLDERHSVRLNEAHREQLLEEINVKASEIISHYSPMVAVKDNDAVPVPYLINNSTDEIISFEELNSKLEKTCSEMAFNRISDIPSIKIDPYALITILNNETTSFKIDYDFESVSEAIIKELNDFKQMREEYSRIFSDFIVNNGFGFEKGTDGNGKIQYCHYNKQSREIYHNAEELMQSPELKECLSEVVKTLKDAAKPIVGESRFVTEIPETYSEWKYFVSDFNKNDENVRRFADKYKHELEVMTLASNSRMADIGLVYDGCSENNGDGLIKNKHNRKVNREMPL